MTDQQINQIIKKMTLKEKIGQLLVVGFPSYEYDEHIRTLVEDYKIGNIIIFSRNFRDLKQLRLLNKTLYDKIVYSTGIIPFICCDQEGGNVVRIDKEVAYPPMAMSQAASYEMASYDCGKVVGDELIRLGFNLDLAPVVDINSNINNPVMNVRTFGDDKEKVIKCGNLFNKGLKEYGVIGCYKHFPSYGAVDVDPHKGLPYNHDSLEQVMEYDLYPYFHLDDCEMIMSAHLIFDAVDKDSIATLSPKAYQLLRDKMNYQGLIITDCLEMDAVKDTCGTPMGAKLAIKAGADLLCICHTLERQIKAVKMLEEAYLNNELRIEDLDDKVRRILKVKYKTLPSLDKYFFSQKMVINQEADDICQKIVDESLTSIKGLIEIDDKTLIIAPKSLNFSLVEDSNNKKDLAKEIKQQLPHLHIKELVNDNDYLNELKKLSINYDNIVVYTYVGSNSKWQIDFVNELALNNKVSVFSLKGPFDYPKYQNIVNYMCLYEYTEHSIKTVLKYLKKEIKAIGHCPIKL